MQMASMLASQQLSAVITEELLRFVRSAAAAG
jgi:hypothetical protein